MSKNKYKYLLIANDISSVGGIQTYLNQFIETIKEKEEIKIIEIKKKNLSIIFFFKTIISILRSEYLLIGHITLIFFSLLKIFSNKKIIFVYGIDIFKPRFFYSLTLFKYLKFKTIITCSNYTKDYCINKINVKSNIDVIYPYSKFESTNKMNSLFKPNKKIIISSISRLDGYVTKGIWLLLKLYKKHRYQNIIFNICGKGNEEEDIKKFIEKYKIDNINFKGFVEDLSEIYLNSDLFLYLTDQTGLGCVTIDGLYYKKPTIVSSSSASIEAFPKNYFFKINNDEDFNGFEKLLSKIDKSEFDLKLLKIDNLYNNHFNKTIFKRDFLKILND